MRINYTIVFFLLSVSLAYTQGQYIFRHFDIVDGLSDNQIRNLSITPDGRLGIRTASILNIYNGASFEHFYQDKSKEYLWDYTRLPKEYYDSRGRIWMKERDYLLLLDLNTNQFIYDIQSELASYGINRKLVNLFIDDYKNFWFITDDHTLSIYDTGQEKLITVTAGDSDFTKRHGVPVEIVQYKNLCWILYENGLVRCWDYASHEFVLQDTHFVDIITSATDRIYLHPTSTGDLWLMINNGIFFYDRTERSWTEIISISGLSNFFTCMDLDKDENVWAGTSRSGLRYINRVTREVDVIPGLNLEKGGTLVNDIHNILVDENNGVWVGTLFQGVCYYHPSMKKFKLIQTAHSETHITNESVRCFLEDDDGSILTGTKDGLFRFYPDTHKTERLFTDQINDLCLSLYKDSKNRIWAGTYLKGFFVSTAILFEIM